MMPAAMGAEADVPVWLSVQRCLRSVVIIFLSYDSPLLYVVASVDEHSSKYQGFFPLSAVLLMEMV